MRKPGIGAALVAFAIAVLAIVQPANAQLSPQQILTNADRVRNPVPAFRVNNTLLEYRSGKLASTVRLQIRSKLSGALRQYRNLIRYDQPARDRGKILLMDGQLLWFFDPASGATVRISPQQRLSGQVANGDVLTANLANDYRAASAVSETIVDADKAARTTWHLVLIPSNARAIYGKIEYWIDAASYVPVKARFFADSGRLLKVAFYRKYSAVMGGTRPTEAIILNAVDSSLVTKMVFDGFQIQDTPDAWFQKDYLAQLGTR